MKTARAADRREGNEARTLAGRQGHRKQLASLQPAATLMATETATERPQGQPKKAPHKA